MAETSSKVPVKTEKMPPSTLPAWRPFESLRREIDRLFEDFDGSFWRSPLRRSSASSAQAAFTVIFFSDF